MKIAEIRDLIKRFSEDNLRLREYNDETIYTIQSLGGRIGAVSSDAWHDQLRKEHLCGLLTADHEALSRLDASTRDGLLPVHSIKLIEDNNTLNSRLRTMTAANTLLQFDYAKFTRRSPFRGNSTVRGAVISLMFLSDV